MIVGITGGIGSGKSYCAKIFEQLAVPVYYSDTRAKELMTQDEDLRNGLITLFGTESYLIDGSLNRKHLSSLIFNNKELLNKMNALVHPAVRADFMQWCQHHLQNSAYVMQESALVYETGSYKLLSKVILVDAPVELRINRVLQRDHTTREEIISRIDKQLPSSEKRAKADFIIDNDGSDIVNEVMKVHFSLMG